MFCFQCMRAHADPQVHDLTPAAVRQILTHLGISAWREPGSSGAWWYTIPAAPEYRNTTEVSNQFIVTDTSL